MNPPETAIVHLQKPQVIEGELIHPTPHTKARITNAPSFREKVIAGLACLAFMGLMALAFMDRDYRPAFVSFAYAFLGAYVGVQVTKTDERTTHQ